MSTWINDVWSNHEVATNRALEIRREIQEQILLISVRTAFSTIAQAPSMYRSLEWFILQVLLLSFATTLIRGIDIFQICGHRVDRQSKERVYFEGLGEGVRANE